MSSSIVPEECIGFHKRWLEDGHSQETTDDLDTRDVIKALIGLHHEMSQNTTENNIHSLLDRLNTKNNDQHRFQQIQLAKQLVEQQKLSLVDAIFLVFSREELVA
jgi:hypothetical protein